MPSKNTGKKKAGNGHHSTKSSKAQAVEQIDYDALYRKAVEKDAASGPDCFQNAKKCRLDEADASLSMRELGVLDGDTIGTDPKDVQRSKELLAKCESLRNQIAECQTRADFEKLERDFKTTSDEFVAVIFKLQGAVSMVHGSLLKFSETGKLN